MKRTIAVAATLTASLALPAFGASTASEASLNASAALSVGVGSIMLGSASLASASGQLVVESVEKTADGVLLVLREASKSASAAGRISLRIGGDLSGAASVAVGQSVEVVTESAGAAIVASGKIIAFIPNEIGKSLIHHSPVDPASTL